MVMDLERLGHAFRTQRLALGKTLAEVGGHADCTRQNVYKVEKALSNPTVNTLERIADGLDMDLQLVVLPRAIDPRLSNLVERVLHAVAEGDEERLGELARAVVLPGPATVGGEAKASS